MAAGDVLPASVIRRRSGCPANAVSIDAWQRGYEVTCRALAVQPVGVVVTGGGSPEPRRGARVSPGFFEWLRVEPLRGLLFQAGDSAASAAASRY